jgi:hypothetical protein
MSSLSLNLQLLIFPGSRDLEWIRGGKQQSMGPGSGLTKSSCEALPGLLRHAGAS